MHLHNEWGLHLQKIQSQKIHQNLAFVCFHRCLSRSSFFWRVCWMNMRPNLCLDPELRGFGVVIWSGTNPVYILTSINYLLTSIVGCQALWLRSVMNELSQPQWEATSIFCDNKSTIALSKNSVFHGKSKHIRLKFHFVWELVKDQEIEVEYCCSKDQVADIFTKSFQGGAFNHLKKNLGVANV